MEVKAKVKEAIEYWESLHKTFSTQLENEENYFGRMHLQTTIDILNTTISALRNKCLPEKVETFNCEELCDVEDWYDSGYADGWNACIDKILNN
jgi:hypothetical protein